MRVWGQVSTTQNINSAASTKMSRLLLALNIFLTFVLVVLIGMIASNMAYIQFRTPTTIVVIAAVTAIITNVFLSIGKRLFRAFPLGRAFRAKA